MVVDRSDSRPIASATVEAYGHRVRSRKRAEKPAQAGSTGSDGVCELSEGDVALFVSARHPDYVSNGEMIGPDQRSVVLALDRGFVLRGVVRSAVDQSPLANVPIAASFLSRPTDFTDIRGTGDCRSDAIWICESDEAGAIAIRLPKDRDVYLWCADGFRSLTNKTSILRPSETAHELFVAEPMVYALLPSGEDILTWEYAPLLSPYSGSSSTRLFAMQVRASIAKKWPTAVIHVAFAKDGDGRPPSPMNFTVWHGSTPVVSAVDPQRLSEFQSPQIEAYHEANGEALSPVRITLLGPDGTPVDCRDYHVEWATARAPTAVVFRAGEASLPVGSFEIQPSWPLNKRDFVSHRFEVDGRGPVEVRVQLNRRLMRVHISPDDFTNAAIGNCLIRLKGDGFEHSVYDATAQSFWIPKASRIELTARAFGCHPIDRVLSIGEGDDVVSVPIAFLPMWNGE